VLAAAQGRRILVVAETGLDATSVAQLIHHLDPARHGDLTSVDCATADGLALDSALFGRAAQRPSTRVEDLDSLGPGAALARVAGGSLLLANIHEMPGLAQARLSRLLRDGQAWLEEAGRVEPLAVRIVGVGPPSLDDDVRRGRFRLDLFRRLSSSRIDLPPLRQRPEDIAIIVRQLDVRRPDNGQSLAFTKAALALLAALPWEGNLLELHEVLERLRLGERVGTVRIEDVVAALPMTRHGVPPGQSTLREARRQFEREYIAAVLREHGWRMRDAARVLGIQRTNLYRKARQLNIRRVKVSR